MRRCEHGVYWPEGHALAFGCQFCNPEANEPLSGAQETPKFNRRGSLNLTETGRLPKCPKCNVPVTASSGGKCRICGETYELNVAGQKLRANNKQPGICPECGSGVHFERGRKWECADCGTVYNPKKRK